MSKAVVKNRIGHDIYTDTLVANRSLTAKVTGIRSFMRDLFVYRQEKTALASYYGKLKMLDSINCEP